MSGIPSVLVLLAHCMILVPAFLIPGQVPANATVQNLAFPTNATSLKGQPVIPGFRTALTYWHNYAIKPEDTYLCAIEFMYELVSSGWEEIVPSGYEAFSKEVNGLRAAFASLAQPEDKYQLQSKHLVLGFLTLMNTLASRKSFCNTKAVLYVYNKSIGQLAIGRPVPATLTRINSTDSILSSVDPITSITEDRGFTAVREIVDPEDSDVVISYEMEGDSIPCQALLNLAVNVLANSAPAKNNDLCKDFGGSSSSGEVACTFSRNPPGTTRFLLTYDLVRRALRLLPARLYSEESCAEVKFDIIYRGEELGGGSFYLP